MTDFDNKDNQLIIFNGVNNPMISNPYTPRLRRAFHLDCSMWTRINGQMVNGASYTLPDGTRQCIKLLSNPVWNNNFIRHAWRPFLL